MFTGIVHSIITVISTAENAGCLQIVLTAPVGLRFNLGDSILLNGICSTITALSSKTLTVEYMPQTRRVTTVDHWRKADRVNCEPPLTLQTKLSGSIVTGHVDTIASVKRFEPGAAETALLLQWSAPSPYVVPQGAITIDGVNLTISARLDAQCIEVQIIPYTLAHTTLQTYRPGRTVNVEYDYIAKLLLAGLSPKAWPQVARPAEGAAATAT